MGSRRLQAEYLMGGHATFSPRVTFLVLAFASLGMAMESQPFQHCTDQAKVNSILSVVFIDDGLIHENAPYRAIGNSPTMPGPASHGRRS